MHQMIQSNPSVNVKMVFMEHPDLDLLRYNAPTSRTEVAAIFVGDDGEPPTNRDICIYPVADGCRNISSLYQCSDPIVYPLLFPHGECGWNSNMEHVEERISAKRVRVTQLQYYSYRFAVQKSHVIMRVAVHLPNQKQVLFQSGQEVADVARDSMRHTKLTAWFLLNQHNVEAHNYKYVDIPQYYVFDKSQTLWKKDREEVKK
ncbi:hypothetical protein AVEN_261850-1 [Araneus ventricosus]|uniref:Helitron helicase-like domain-containing protein n=1 Tax=Araneus ventricosus TaxID=182803 RepID=A0A4Y2WRB7_ARAVE|nr:hypothetical protein AVEN_261850-1 [Araneus ventricosus]